MTLNDAIKHCFEVAEQNETSAITYKNCKEIKTNMYEKLTAEKAENDCRECAADHRQLAEWLSELKEAKRLLKAAAKIAKNLPCDDDNCGECVHNDNGYVCSEYECFEWRYANEALALIGEEGDTE